MVKLYRLERKGLRIERYVIEDNSGEIIIVAKKLDYFLNRVTLMWFNPYRIEKTTIVD